MGTYAQLAALKMSGQLKIRGMHHQANIRQMRHNASTPEPDIEYAPYRPEVKFEVADLPKCALCNWHVDPEAVLKNTVDIRLNAHWAICHKDENRRLRAYLGEEVHFSLAELGIEARCLHKGMRGKYGN